MTHNDYIKDATRTESVPPELVSSPSTIAALTGIIAATIALSSGLDQFKKHLFYTQKEIVEGVETGNVVPRALNRAAVQNCLVECSRHVAYAARELDGGQYDNVRKTMQLTAPQMRLLHGIIGKSTESAELLVALLVLIDTGKIDIVNVGEELGDDEWYSAILYDVLQSEVGITQDMVRATNIAKLKKRYKDKFDSDEATNRDLNAERKTLEAGLGNSDKGDDSAQVRDTRETSDAVA